MMWLARRAWIEAHYAAQCAGYWIRPYDQILDARRWRWRPRGRCQFSMTPEEFEEFRQRWLASLETFQQQVITGDGEGQPRGFLQ